MILTTKGVNNLVLTCLFAEYEPTDDAIVVDGIATRYGFHRERVTHHRGDIIELLMQLPDEFQAGKGGGGPFWKAARDRRGKIWATEGRVMESLLCLGIAAGAAKWTLPRALWVAFPDGMPFVTVNIQPKA